MPDQPYQQELRIAVDAVLAAQDLIRAYFKQDVAIEIKPDASPVTQADIESEKVIRDHITKAFPSHGFYGEETGEHAMDAEFLWLVDPIDGTKSFVRDLPFFSTQVALMYQGNVVVGVSNAPATGELASAVVGQGATLNGKSLATSGVVELQDVYLSSGNLKSLAASSAGWQAYGRLLQQVSRSRGYGDYCHYHQLAGGQADVVIESDVNILDVAALSLIVTEAGGSFTDLEGCGLSLKTTSVLATANQPLHDKVFTQLQGNR